MSEEKKTRITKSNNLKTIVVFIIAVSVASSGMIIYFSNNPVQKKQDTKIQLSDDPPNKSVYNPSGSLNLTKFVENELYKVPDSCYIVYENSLSKSDNDTLLYFYNDTKLAILDTPIVNNNAQALDRFIHLSETQIYFYYHCTFFDSKKNPIPFKFDSNLGEKESIDEKKKRIDDYKEELLRLYDFNTQAKKANSILLLAQDFLMTPEEVTKKMISSGVLDLKSDCSQGSRPDSNSTVYMCKWKTSNWLYDVKSGDVTLQ